MEKTTSSKSLTKNSLFYLVYNVLNVMFPLITGIYVARVLLQSDIGSIESARNLSQYFVILSFLGIPTYGMREISKVRKSNSDLNKVYSELFIINAISTFVLILLYLITIISVPNYRNNFSLFLIAGISIVLNFFNNTWLFDGLEEFGYISIRNIIIKILSFIFLILFVRTQSDYIKYLLITIFGTAGNYFLNIFHSRKFVKFTIKELNLRQHLKPILYLSMVNLAIEIYSLVDVTMLGLMTKETNVAIYSYGMKIHKIFLTVINSFTMVIVPRITMYYKENRFDEFNHLITKTIKIIILLALPTIIGISFVSDYVITALYGEQYFQSAHVLKILSPILLISPVGYLLGSRMLLVTGNEKKMIIAVGLGAATNLLLNSFFIHKYQELGAAFASLLSEIVVTITYIYLGKRYYKLSNLFDTLWKILVSLILMVGYLIPISFINWPMIYITIIQIIGAVIIYFFTLLLLKENTIYSILSKIKAKLC